MYEEPSDIGAPRAERPNCNKAVEHQIINVQEALPIISLQRRTLTLPAPRLEAVVRGLVGFRTSGSHVAAWSFDAPLTLNALSSDTKKPPNPDPVFWGGVGGYFVGGLAM